jgi:molybdate transport system permease protein
MPELEPLWLSVSLASIVTIILLVISVPLAYWISQSKSGLRIFVETIVCMPMVLPPSVLGFYLLLAFSPLNAFGGFLDRYFDIRLVFSFQGLVIASVIYSLPFMVQPIQGGFKALPSSLQEASFTLGISKLNTLVHVLLPNIKPALITGIVISFAHTLGEFGVVMMIGGNIPGKTRLVSVAIYDEVQAQHYHSAAVYSGILFLFTFLVLFLVYYINRRLHKLQSFQ